MLTFSQVSYRGRHKVVGAVTTGAVYLAMGRDLKLPAAVALYAAAFEALVVAVKFGLAPYGLYQVNQHTALNETLFGIDDAVGAAERVAIGTGAKMANGLLFSLLSWLLLRAHGASLGMCAAFLVLLMVLYGTSLFTLARYPERAVIGYKG